MDAVEFFAEQYMIKIPLATRVARIVATRQKFGDVATTNALGCKLFGPNMPGHLRWGLSSDSGCILFIIVYDCEMLDNPEVTHGVIADQFTVSYGMSRGMHSSIIWDKE
jgi:hypothetical protein